MTHDQKIKYMNMAAGICGFGIGEKHLDMLVSTYELVLEKEGQTSVHDMARVENEVNQRQEAKERSKLLDKVSEKVD